MCAVRQLGVGGGDGCALCVWWRQRPGPDPCASEFSCADAHSNSYADTCAHADADAKSSPDADTDTHTNADS